MKHDEPDRSQRQEPQGEAPAQPARESTQERRAPAEPEGAPRPVVLRITPLRTELDESGGH